MVELGASSKLNAEWAFLCHAARRGPPRRRRPSWRRTATIWASAPRSISTACWKASERWACSASCSASALLVWLAFRGWSVLLLAPAAALLAAAFAGEPLLAHWTQTFMGSAARFLAQFFPLFLLGALFGKLMEDSGSVTAIADCMTGSWARCAPCWRWCWPARSSPMAASACSSPSSCWRRWPRRCSAPPPSRAG